MRNLRDAGDIAGLSKRILYRSDDPRYRPFQTCQKLKSLKIRSIIKLNAFQRSFVPSHRPFWQPGPCGIPEYLVSLPFRGTRGAFGVSIYDLGARLPRLKQRRVVRFMERQLQHLFKAMARMSPANLPLLVHCSVGRDRTGIVVAMILRLAGASRALVERDYLISKTTVGHTAVFSLRRVFRRIGPVRRYLRTRMGLKMAELDRIAQLIHPPKAKTERGIFKAPNALGTNKRPKPWRLPASQAIQ